MKYGSVGYIDSKMQMSTHASPPNGQHYSMQLLTINFNNFYVFINNICCSFNLYGIIVDMLI